MRGVSYENVCLRNVGNPILLDTRYTNFAGDKIPVYRDIVLRDVRSMTPGGLAFLGFDEKNRIGVTLDNVNVVGPDARPARRARRDHRRPAQRQPGAERQRRHAPATAAPSRARRSIAARASCRSSTRATAPASAIKVPPVDHTYYVAASGNGDYYSIQRALDVAPPTGTR